MARHDLTATSYFGVRLWAACLWVVGMLIWTAPGFVTDLFGSDARAAGFGVFVALIAVAALWVDNHRLRAQHAETIDALNQLLYGKDYTRDREAIEILIQALGAADEASRRTAHEHLVRLTGLSFVADAHVWSAWWRAHQKSWARRRAADPPAPGSPSAPPSASPGTPEA